MTPDHSVNFCELCGGGIPPTAPQGQCPRCLLSLGSGFSGIMLGAEDFFDPTESNSFGDYRLIEEIARGGMGVVYRAQQMSLGREVAVKMILAGELATTESVQRFRNEAAAAARLDHPNIVSVYEIGEHDMQHFFSMRLVLGRKNIAGWEKSLSLVGAERAVCIATMMAKVARAVEFAHERGVMHRDLKPSNILVDEKGEPQVTDFGLAKLVGEQNPGLTLTDAMLGSPSYMAPEQASPGVQDVTTATDVYGLGAVLYELLSGRPPFVGASALATAKMVVEQAPAPITGTSRDLSTICLKCLAKDPAHRYHTAEALAEDLERFARGDAILARPVSAPEAVWRWARRRPKIAAMLCAFLLALLAGFAGVTWQWRRAEKARVEQQKSLDHLRWQEIARQADTSDAPRALAQLAAILRADPQRWQAAMLAMSVIDQHAFPVLAGPPVHPPGRLLTPPRLALDGSWFAAVGEGNILRVWDTATGRERSRIALQSPATALAVARGPLAFAVAMSDGSLEVYAAAEASPVVLRQAGAQQVHGVSFSADGSHLTARTHAGIEVWKTAAPDQVALTLALDGGISGSGLSQDGRRVLGWNSKRAVIWDSTSGRALFEITARADFRRASLSANGRRVALIDGEFMARSWDVDAASLLSEVESPLTPWRQLALNATGTRLTILGSANELVVHDTASGLQVSASMGHLYQPHSLHITADGTRTVSFAKDGRACVWSAETGRPELSAIWLNSDLPAAIDTSGDGQYVLVYPEVTRDGPSTVSVWRSTRTRPAQRHTIPTQRDFNAGRISPDGRLGCIGAYPGNRAYVYELATGRVLLDAVTKGHVYVHLFSPDMRKCYVFTANGWHYGWDLETGTELWPPSQQPGMIRPAEISPDGTRLLAGHNDGHIRIYDSATGALVQTLDHPGEVKTLRFAPDDSGRFLSGSTDGVAHLWDLRSGRKLQTYSGHSGPIIASAWSPDSCLIATASYDQTARVWDAASGRPVGNPLLHLSWLSHLEFSPDGRRLATACRDGTARLWDPLSTTPTSPPLAQASTAETVRFTPDGACFLVRDHQGFRFWDTERAEPVSIHYPEPSSGGLGMDAESWRGILSPDGTQVFIGFSVNAGSLWTIPQPRGTTPPWFPDFLEGLAFMRMETADSLRVISPASVLHVNEELRQGLLGGYYADWARRILPEQGE